MAMLAQASRLWLRRLVSPGPSHTLSIFPAFSSEYSHADMDTMGAGRPAAGSGGRAGLGPSFPGGCLDAVAQIRIDVQCSGRSRCLEQAAACRLYSAAPAAPKAEDSGEACT